MKNSIISIISIVLVSGIFSPFVSLAENKWQAQPQGVVAKEAYNYKSPLGTNAAADANHATVTAYKDLFKRSDDWRVEPTGKLLSEVATDCVDENDWLLRIPEGYNYVRTTYNLFAEFDAGEYVLLFDGEGTIAVGPSYKNRVDVTTQEGETGGRIEFTMQSMANHCVYIEDTKPENPIKNIRILKKEHEDNYIDEPFLPLFLETLRHFSVIRFMDAVRTNGSTQVTWDDRRTATYRYEGGSKGMAYESLIGICNELNASPWFNIPHLADDDYIRQLATMIKSDLNENLRVYLEYSNETWNTGFTQYFHCAQKGYELFKDEWGFTEPGKIGAGLYTTHRSLEIFEIFREVFGDEMDDRVVRVLATHVGATDYMKAMLEHEDAYKKIDAFALAPYFNISSIDFAETTKEGEKWTAEDYLDYMAEQMRTDFTKTSFPGARKSIDMAYLKGVRPIMYEGGQHWTVPQNYKNILGTELFSETVEVLAEGNRHPKMGELYKTYLDTWREVGGGLLVHYSHSGAYGQYGYWGSFEKLYAPETYEPFDVEHPENHKAYKYKALQEFATNNDTWWTEKTTLVTNLHVSECTDPDDWSIEVDIKEGDTIFGDGDATITEISEGLKGNVWIQTAKESDGIASFVPTVYSHIYVGAEGQKPAWMDGEWMSTGETIRTSEGKTLNFYKKTFPRQFVVTLGSSACVAIVKPVGGDTPGYARIFGSSPMITDAAVNAGIHAMGSEICNDLKAGDRTAGDDYFKNTFLSVPDILEGCDWIRMDRFVIREESPTNEPYMTFKVKEDTDVYVATWEKDVPSWIKNGEWIYVPRVFESSNGYIYSVYKKFFPAGSKVDLWQRGASVYAVILKEPSEVPEPPEGGLPGSGPSPTPAPTPEPLPPLNPSEMMPKTVEIASFSQNEGKIDISGKAIKTGTKHISLKVEKLPQKELLFADQVITTPSGDDRDFELSFTLPDYLPTDGYEIRIGGDSLIPTTAVLRNNIILDMQINHRVVTGTIRSADPLKGVLIVCLYDNQKNIISISKKDVSESTESAYELGFWELPKTWREEEYKIYAYLWSGNDTVRPLIDYAIMR